MKLVESTESKITKDKNVELALFHCNLVNNDCQLDSRILHTFSKQTILCFIRNFTNQLYLFKNI